MTKWTSSAASAFSSAYNKRSFITCTYCDGSGLALNFEGEPDECPVCKGNTVVPNKKVNVK